MSLLCLHKNNLPPTMVQLGIKLTQQTIVGESWNILMLAVIFLVVGSVPKTNTRSDYV